jgi:hypothetical protein
MSLSEEMPSKQPVFSSCEAAIRSKDQEREDIEREDIERATQEFLRKKKNQIDEVPPNCNKLGGIDPEGHKVRESTRDRLMRNGVSYPAHLPRPSGR